MKRLFVLIILLAAANYFIAKTIDFVSGSSPDTDSVFVLQPEQHHAMESQLINTIINRYHYNRIQYNDSLSSAVYDRYLKTLDNGKLYFLADDIEEFESERFAFLDYIRKGDLSVPFNIFNRLITRVDERHSDIKRILENEFDYTIDEEYEYKREDALWAENKEELFELWRKRIKNDALNLRLADKEWDSIHETLTKRYSNYRKALRQYKSEDVFQLVMNAFTQTLDPHSNYLSPITSENFKINMSLSLEGIGAQLQTEDDYTKVAEIIPGGPAHKSGLLKRDDRIIAVAQDDDGDMVDVIGWRITDVVQLIRGPKESVVRLMILPAKDGVNAVPTEIRIVRDKVILEEQSAKKSLIEVENDGKQKKIGVISIPTFYTNLGGSEGEFKSTTVDVKKLLEELKSEKVDGVIIDLRNDGGGSLTEAIELTGLFINGGPVVQVRHSDGKVDIGEYPEPRITYDGPLAVLVNRYSASASEIFAGAIQDYGRGIVIGERTFGKGTVQNLIDLNRLLPSAKNSYGQVKLTVAKYYRINGGSTQNKGVEPDIKFPSFADAKEHSEGSESSALPWDQIEPTAYTTFSDLSKVIPKLIAKHEARIKDNFEFDYLLEDIEEYKITRNRTSVSLNESVRKQEKEEREERRFQRENERRKLKGLQLIDKSELPEESEEEEDEEQNDPLLNESSNILADYIAIKAG